MANDLSFLGTNVDIESEELPEAYTQIMLRVKKVRNRWLATPPSERTLDMLKGHYAELQSLMVRDHEGHVWTVSPLTLQWKVKPAGSKKWVSGHPRLGVR